MGLSSRGGPGSIMTNFSFPAATKHPGAVPTVFLRAVAPLGSRAWTSWLSRMGLVPKYSFSLARLSLSSTRGRPSVSAMVFFVRSSSVGPSPPEVMTRSLRERAVSSTSLRRPGLSPTVSTFMRSMPSAASSLAMKAASVLTVCPSRSSVPTEMISAFTGIPPYRPRAPAMTLRASSTRQGCAWVPMCPSRKTFPARQP